MKEILDAINARIKSPIFGYYILFTFFFNWKAFFYLLASDKTVTDKFLFFDDETTFVSLLVYPLLFAAIYTIIHPWINFAFSFMTSKAIEKKRTLQTIVEHKVLIKKEELERVRAKLLETQERTLIEKAKREEEINTIEDEKLREKLQKEINELRNSSSSSVLGNNSKMREMALTLKRLAKIAERENRTDEAKKLLNEALTIERENLK